MYRYRFEEATAPFPPGSNAAGYTSASCNPSRGCECSLPNGLGTVEDKTVVVLHRQETGFTVEGNIVKPPCSQACSESDSVSLRCDSGTWRNSQTDEAVDPRDSAFVYRYRCEDSVCPDCPLVGFGSIPNNQEFTLYPKNVMTCSDNPELLQAQFTCFGGVLKKNGNIVAADAEPTVTWHQSFTNECTGCETPWGVEHPFGAEVLFYKESGSGNVSNPCGQGCKSVLRTCKPDGTWDGIEAELKDFTLQSCVNECSEEGGGAPPRLCLLPWQNSYVTPDTEVPMWSRRQVGCNESCQDYYRLGKCQMSTGTFDAGFEFIYQSCTEVCP
ncbi:MAG: hypothetical protein AAF203_00640 [Pseudomonadota bacterium]